MNIEHKNTKLPNIIGLLFSFLFVFSINISAQDAANGEKLFKNKGCTACHALDKKKLGPALKGVTDTREKEWLYSFIKNSTEFITKDADAKALFDEYKISMPAHDLSNEEIDDILEYTKGETVKATETKEAPVESTTTTQTLSEEDAVYQKLEPQNSSAWWQILVLLVFSAIVYFFAKINQNFAAIFMLIITLFSAAYFTFAWFLQIGVDTGYKPEQPIEFSHKIHAGDNGIDCEYCHSSAKHSKTSGIPTMNVCMNCHKSIGEFNGEVFGGHDKEFFTKEIGRVREHAGWDADEFAYTSEGKGVEWVRVHNLPDFVYYNHSQHVNVAGLECQTCHGPVEKMHRVEQYAQLTMDWCITCHKDTEVNMENGYYSGTYENAADAHKGMTVADMGGMECGKCHY